ncbi:MAG TPA: hypothetical protein VGQ06_03280 [Gemmatimonadales bacterium]|jgi:hypothetical protein|nr:hypothetical protein [Gemmatimonadales bacterium]
MTSDFAVRSRIGKLATALKAFSPRLGYTEILQHGRLVKYRVHTKVLGDRDIPIQPGRESAAREQLLKELENLARYYKPSLLLADTKPLPAWLAADARAFCDHPSLGLHRFGKQITIRGTGEGGRAEEHLTREQLIQGSTTSLDTFRYLPLDKALYKGDVQYRAAMGWNFSMYYYIEKQGVPPSRAGEQLSGLQRELVQKIMLELAIPGTNEKARAAGDAAAGALEAVMHIIHRR